MRKREPQLVDCSLLDVIEDSITLIEPLARKQRVTILHLLPARLPIIHGDPVLLGQVLINLMVSAASLALLALFQRMEAQPSGEMTE